MEYIAHRGCADQFPENTMRAIQSVVNHVDRIELDVFRCGSGEIILFHDEFTGKLTDGDYTVTETEYATLRDLNVLGTDERIPLLSEALEVIPETVDVQLDLKHAGIADAVEKITSQFPHDIYLCSTDSEILTEAIAKSWDASPGYVSFAYFQYEDVNPASVTEADWRDAVNTATRLGCTFLEVPYELCLESNIVDGAHEAGLNVVAWTIRTREQLEHLEVRDIDAAMIDRIDIIEPN